MLSDFQRGVIHIRCVYLCSVQNFALKYYLNLDQIFDILTFD